jgi:hydrogenase-4 component E
MVNLLLITVILINFYTLGSARLVACIRAVALQGGLLALLPLATHGPSGHALLLGVGALTFKGILIPWLLLRAIREVRIRTLVTAAAFIFADFLPLAAEHLGGMFVPTSLATMFSGFLLLITRRKALTQVLGYLVLENGIFVFAVLLSEAIPLMVETGILLDLLVGVFVMGIVLNHIGREFSTLNTKRLTALKE